MATSEQTDSVEALNESAKLGDAVAQARSTGQGTWDVAGKVTHSGAIMMASIVTKAADVAFDNQSGSTAIIGSLNNSGDGVIQNAGSLTVTTLTPGAGSVTNSNTLVVTTLAMGSGHAASSPCSPTRAMQAWGR